MKTSILRPGLLVALHTAVRGGISYSRVDLQRDQVDENGTRTAEWQTRKQIDDAAEYDAAIVARGKCRTAILRHCSQLAFGYMARQDKEFDLGRGIDEARAIAQEFNRTAQRSFVEISVVVGRVAQDDAEAGRAISNEVRALLDEMNAGIKAADPAAIRDAANRARQVAAMLSDDVAGKVDAAINQARSAARAIVKRVQKAGESAAVVVAECLTTAIDTARMGVLDLEPGAASAESAPVAGRAIDLPPAAPTEEGAARVQAELRSMLEF